MAVVSVGVVAHTGGRFLADSSVFLHTVGGLLSTPHSERSHEPSFGVWYIDVSNSRCAWSPSIAPSLFSLHARFGRHCHRTAISRRAIDYDDAHRTCVPAAAELVPLPLSISSLR